MIDLAALTADDFEVWSQASFSVMRPDGAGGAVPEAMEVIEVVRLPRRGPGREPFSVLFGADPDLSLEQDVHRLDHPVAGPLDILLVPMAPRDGRARYEAVFA